MRYADPAKRGRRTEVARLTPRRASRMRGSPAHVTGDFGTKAGAMRLDYRAAVHRLRRDRQAACSGRRPAAEKPGSPMAATTTWYGSTFPCRSCVSRDRIVTDRTKFTCRDAPWSQLTELLTAITLSAPARPKAETAIAMRRNDHAHHAAGHHQFDHRRLAVGICACRCHLDQRAAGVDFLAQHVCAGIGPSARYGLIASPSASNACGKKNTA